MRWLVLVGTLLAASQAAPEVKPLANAHAHNDYEHMRPLFDALDNGFCSVEADPWLVDGKLLVAHDRTKVDPSRTLQSLYLDPLRDWVKTHHGHVYGPEPEFWLLIDVKSDAEETWRVLRDVLKQYSDILTEFGPDYTKRKAVTAVISGNRAIATMAAEKVRYAGVDGRLPDLGKEYNAHLMPWISDSWFPRFRWRGSGTMPEGEREQVRKLAAAAHAKGMKLRFWATPDLPAFWKEEVADGVDLLNADDLPGLRRFLTGEAKP